MKIDILTIFPEFFNEFLNTSIIKRAISKKSVKVNTVNIRDFSKDKNKRIDDTPCGGGAGLVMKVEPLVEAIKSVKTKDSKVIYLSPKGRVFNQGVAKELATHKHLVLVCGHYEGIDERVLNYVDEEISIGDYILTGGEIAAMVVSDSVIRLLDGAISKDSLIDESFENGLLEYPQYTLPKVYKGMKVPEILFSGNHKAISKWRKKESLRITLNNRKDLLSKYKLNKEEKELLKEIKEDKVGKWEIEAINKSKKLEK